MKKICSCISAVLLLLALCLPLTVSAVEGEQAVPYSLSVDFKVNGAQSDASLVFAVTKSTLDFDDDDQMILTDTAALDDFTIKGKTVYNFKNGTELAHYAFKLKSCSDSSVAIGNYVIEVNFYSQSNVKTELLKDGVSDGDQSFADEPADIVLNLTKTSKITVTTDGCEPINKVYDGKTEAVVTDKNFKLSGVADGHEVKLTYEKAEYNSADVKKATKVTLSGLKLTGKDADKYSLKSDKTELKATVSPRTITVTADSLVMTLGQAEPQLTYKLSEELIDSNKAVGALARTSGNTVGTYTVTRGTLSFGDNYSVTFIDGSLTISNYSYSEKIDPATGIKISGYYDPSAALSVSALDPQNEKYTALAAGTDWGKIIAAYDIGFNFAGSDGDLTFSFPADGKYEGKVITVYQTKSDGSISVYQANVIGGRLTLTTDECTQFMLVTAEGTKTNDSGSSTRMTFLKVIIIILAVIIGLALLIALIFFGMIFFNKTDELKRIIKTIKHILGKK